jgi:hypothetical protein
MEGPIFWFAQAVGLMGLIFSVLAYQEKTRNGILSRQSMGSIVYVAHYLLLSAWTGALTNAIVFVRNQVFMRKDEHAWANHPAWMYFFMLLAVAIVPFTWQGYISLLPMVALLLGIYARWYDDPTRIRLFALIGTMLWIPYNIAVHSYAGLAVDAVIAGAIIYGMFTHDRRISSAQKQSGVL